MKKLFLVLFATISLFANTKKEKIVIAGPFATVSHPIMHMIKTNALSDVADKVEFRLWKNPDELRAIVLKGDVDFTAIPTNVGANLYNKGAKIQLLNVSVWGILGMLSRDENLKSLKDFKGKEIVVPFREDMPDIVFRTLLKKQGLDPKKDFTLRYVASPIDAMQMLIMRRVDHALLAEPAISMALRKTGSYPLKLVAPDLYRSTDLQKEWGEVFESEDKIPQAGMAALGDQDPYIIKRFLEEYEKSLQWYKNNPNEAGKLTVETLKMLKAPAIADSIPFIRLESLDANSAKDKLEFFFNILKDENPKLIGGKLPDSGYYYSKEDK